VLCGGFDRQNYNDYGEYVTVCGGNYYQGSAAASLVRHLGCDGCVSGIELLFFGRIPYVMVHGTVLRWLNWWHDFMVVSLHQAKSPPR